MPKPAIITAKNRLNRAFGVVVFVRKVSLPHSGQAVRPTSKVVPQAVPAWSIPWGLPTPTGTGSRPTRRFARIVHFIASRFTRGYLGVHRDVADLGSRFGFVGRCVGGGCGLRFARIGRPESDFVVGTAGDRRERHPGKVFSVGFDAGFLGDLDVAQQAGFDVVVEIDVDPRPVDPRERPDGVAVGGHDPLADVRFGGCRHTVSLDPVKNNPWPRQSNQSSDSAGRPTSPRGTLPCSSSASRPTPVIRTSETLYSGVLAGPSSGSSFVRLF